jgi:hypothetical protein
MGEWKIHDPETGAAIYAVTEQMQDTKRSFNEDASDLVSDTLMMAKSTANDAAWRHSPPDWSMWEQELQGRLQQLVNAVYDTACNQVAQQFFVAADPSGDTR